MLNIYADIEDDGTFLFADNTLFRQDWNHGYTVAIQPQNEMEYPRDYTYVGRWTDSDTGIVYWDRVENIESLLEAGNTARMRGELAIWDNLNNREFRV